MSRITPNQYDYFDNLTPSPPRKRKRGEPEEVGPAALPTPGLSQAPVLEEIPQVTLSLEQKTAVDLMLAGHNVYITGSAGSGKSSVIKEAARQLRAAGKTLHLVAPTGRAAVEVGGTTLHSFASWSPTDSKKSVRALEKLAQGGRAAKRFEDVEVLIIDEISMVSSHILEKLNRVIRIGKDKEDEAFGGIQIIVCGDFCQLPPIRPFDDCFNCGTHMTSRTKRKVTKYECESCGEEEVDKDKWAFRSQVWEEADFHNIYLTENHRQTDATFIKILDKIRLGIALSPTNLDTLLNHESNTEGAIQLFPKRKPVEGVNKEMFAALAGKSIRYKCVDYFQSDQRNRSFDYRNVRLGDNTLKYLHDHVYDRWVELKKGMRILLLANIDVEGGLVNGSQGMIVDFEDYDEAKLPKSKAGIEQEPISADSGFPGGSSDENAKKKQKREKYVNSRHGEFANLRHSQMLDFIKNPDNKHKKWPVVQFDNGRKVTIFADCRLDQLGTRYPMPLEGRTQIPLLPLWAMTLHKAQGLSLDKVRVNLDGRWEAGQTYVALSRAKTLGGLKVESMPQISDTDVDKTVKKFHEETKWALGRPNFRS